jgi:outer membrane protein OmpA-like peptidoglycan-associated protein
MKSILTSLLLILIHVCHAQPKVKSFYFLMNQREPTLYSQEQLAKLSSSVNTGSIIVLEINAFTDSIGTPAFNDTLAKQRLDYFTSRIRLTDSTRLNAYGLRRPYLLPNTLNWRRVDIVYSIYSGPKMTPPLDLVVSSEEKIVVTQETPHEEDLSFLEDDPVVEEPIVVNMFEESLTSLKPLVLDISFKEGTARLLESSNREVNRLCSFLKENPQVKVEVRGHVCCGNNMRISKNRARAVYRKLIKAGIQRDRLSFVGMSNKEPLVFPERTNADRQLNRRVDVKLYL